MLVPLYGFLKHDTLGLVVLVQDHDTLATVAEALQRAACMRVAPRTGLRVYFHGKALNPEDTVAAAGLVALDRIDVRGEQDPPSP